jgi:hypothetical protein
MNVEVADVVHQEVEDKEALVGPEEENSGHLKFSFNNTDCLEYLLLEGNKIA